MLDRSRYFKKGGRDGKAPTKVKPEWQVILSASLPCSKKYFIGTSKVKLSSINLYFYNYRLFFRISTSSVFLGRFSSLGWLYAVMRTHFKASLRKKERVQHGR